MGLHSCKSCHRHVRANDASCPFCGAAQLARLAIGGAVVMGSLASCRNIVPQPQPLYGAMPAPSASATLVPGPQPLYGAFAPSPSPTPDGPVPMYGAPAPQ